MLDKDFLYTLYNQELVDYTINSTKNFYTKNNFSIDMKIAEIIEKRGMGNIANTLYESVQCQLIWSFLRGVSYAIGNKLTTAEPLEKI